MPSNNSSRIKIIGLTGGIASGKNFVAEIFAKNGAAIFDADKEVHQLYELDKQVLAALQKNFSESFEAGKINRALLGKIVFEDAKKLRILEEIIHPRVREKYQEFLENSKLRNKKIIVLNIPLLLEVKVYECDHVLAVIASPSVQKKRFLARHKKNHPENFPQVRQNLEKRFEQIRAKQLSNFERKAVADLVVNTNCAKSDVVKQVKKIIAEI